MIANKIPEGRLKMVFRFFKFLRPYRRQWTTALILSQAAVFVGLINPFLARFAIDESILKKDLRLFLLTAGIGAFIFLLNLVINNGKDFLERYIRVKVNFDLNRYFFSHMQRLSFAWFKDRSTGEHLYKIDNDLNVISDLVSGMLPQALVLVLRFLLILVILCYMNWPIAVLSICLAPLYCLPPYYFSRRIAKVFQEIAECSENTLEKLEEHFSHIQLVKIFGKEGRARRSYFLQLIKVIRLHLKNAKFEIFSTIAMEVVSKVVIGLMTLYGGYLVIQGSLTLGTLTAIMAYFYQLIELQGQFSSFFESIGVGVVSCERVESVLNEEPEISDIVGAYDAVFEKGEIVFENLSFGYKAQEEILKNLSFCIGAGRHVALVGPSGCGKTTLLNLIVRLYDPRTGKILIDGYDIKSLTSRSLKGNIGFSLQEPWLWNDTIANNIRYGCDKALECDILKAAQICGISDFAEKFTRGYDTVIGEQASKISEGQKQKIAIARALIKDPKILILDEAMSMMDSDSEGKILANIKKNYSGITLITVSHRLSAVMVADAVYYLAAPEKMVIGRADVLFKNDPSFSALFSGQDRILSG